MSDKIQKFKNISKKFMTPKVKDYASRTILTSSVFVTAVCITCGFIQKNAQAVYINDVKIGIINNTEIKEAELLEMAEDKLEKDNGVKTEVNEKIVLVPVHASDEETDTDEEIVDLLVGNLTYQVEACSIYVDGKKAITVANKKEAEKILNNVMDSYVEKNANVINKSFAENVTLSSEFVTSKDIASSTEAYNKLKSNTAAEKKYTIKQGDTLWAISQKAGMSLDELLKANPGLTENSILALDSEINLIVAQPYVSVKTITEASYSAKVERPVEVVENNDEYKTYKKVLEEGADGEKTVTANITYLNGIEESREIIKEEVTKEPVTQKIEVGTLQTPPKRALGSFKYPVSGRLSSGYGARWGTSHKGIDLAAPYGTPVYASDGGTVTFSGWNSGGYGYLVIIDHGNGYETYYGHNSSLAVTAGEQVYQGQVIAYVGSTGDSTGNHVHFEVRKNGVPSNPLSYL